MAVLIAASVSFGVGYALTAALYTGGTSPVGLCVSIGGVVLMVLTAWLFVGGLTHSAACLMGGYGHFPKFLSAYAMASMPFTLCTPAALLLSSVGGLGLDLIVLLLALWWWGLTVCAIKELYGLATGAAVVASMLPYVLIAAAAVVAGLALIWLLLGWCFS